MQKQQSQLPKEEVQSRSSAAAVSRRKFLNYAGLSAGALLFASSCKKDFNPTVTSDARVHSEGGGKDGGKAVVNLGSGDTGILNYAYALEQLEAAFYTQAVATPYSGITDMEMEYITDIMHHEIAHREWFKTVLGDSRIGGLIVDFSSIDFSSRASVLGTAKAFEDTGVSAYNGAGELIQNSTYLLYAGKIVSVEARHAATIRDLLNYGSFADATAVNSMGLDLVNTPPEVLKIVAPYVSTKIISNNLPTS